MPDTHQQQGPRTSFNTPFQPASALDYPGIAKPNGGVARAIAFARGMSGKAVLLAGGVFILQAVMPPGSKPSDLLGSFHGALDSAQMKAAQKAQVEYDRAVTDAKTSPPINWQMEAEVARQQQEAIAKSLETQENAAQIADAVCLGAPLATLLMGDTAQARDIARAGQAACAEAARIRADITRIQAEAARSGSALMARNRISP